MKDKNGYRNKSLLAILFLCGLLLLSLSVGASDDQVAHETDSMRSVLSQSTDARVIIPVLLRLADLNEQKEESVVWLERCYREAVRIDSVPAIYVTLMKLLQYYYNENKNRYRDRCSSAGGW